MENVRFGPPVVSVWNEKHLVTLGDGATVEAVRYRGDTLCVSSQVGCAVSCPFCASGADGLQRALSERFPGMVGADGSLDRKKMASLVFRNPQHAELPGEVGQ